MRTAMLRELRGEIAARQREKPSRGRYAWPAERLTLPVIAAALAAIAVFIGI